MFENIDNVLVPEVASSFRPKLLFDTFLATEYSMPSLFCLRRIYNEIPGLFCQMHSPTVLQNLLHAVR